VKTKGTEHASEQPGHIRQQQALNISARRTINTSETSVNQAYSSLTKTQAFGHLFSSAAWSLQCTMQNAQQTEQAIRS